MHYNNLPNARPENPNQFQDAHVPNLPPQPVDMPELNNLSYVVRNCWHHFLFWGIFWIISALISFWNIIFFPLVFTCAGVAYWYWSKHYQESVNLKRCLQTFSWTFWLGSLIAFITEMIVVVIGAVVILNSELMTLSKRWKDRPSQSTCEGYGSKYDCTTNSCSWTGQCDRQTPQDFFSDQESWLVGRATTWIFLMFMAFMVAAGVEETVKYQFASRSIRNYLPPAESISLPFASTILWYGLMAGMGFGTSEGIEYTIFNASPLTALASLALRVLLAIPFHSCCGFLTSIQLTRRHVMKQKIGYFGCIWVPWLCHGFYDFVQFGVVILMYGDDSGAADIVTLIAAIVLTFATFYIGYSRYKALKSELESLIVDPNHNENHHSYQQQIQLNEAA